MKILKLLNKYLAFFFLVFFHSTLSQSNEPVDIWELKDKNDRNKSNEVKENIIDEIKSDEIITQSQNDITIFKDENLFSKKNLLVGLYDPDENGLSIDMWDNSDGDQIQSILKKINNKNLSQDALDILEIALLTNSYPPKNKIDEIDFINFKINFLLNNNNLDLINEFIIKNEQLNQIESLISHYLDQYLIVGNLNKSCNLLQSLSSVTQDNYINKFKIYCLISDNNKEQAQILYDLNRELGFDDSFFDQKFSYLMDYNKNISKDISEKSVLDFHLSHITNEKFNYTPNDNTPEFIWKYLSSYNLLENINNIDLENYEKISTIEKAAHNENYSEADLLNLYTRFQFSFDQLLNIKDTYKILPNYESRALLYQRLMLSNGVKEKLYLAKTLKESMINDEIENAFLLELSKILKKIDSTEVPLEYLKFYQDNIIKEKKITKIKFNNKILHQSKLLNYFIKGYSLEKASKEANDILKKINSNKKYVFSNKDKIILDSIKYDGVELKKKYLNLYDKNPNIPTDLQVLINNDDTGMILLRLVEIIGEDKIENLGTESLYFIITVLNEIDLDKLRNEILLKTLPLKI